MRNLNNILLLGSSGFFGKNIKNHLNQMNAKIFEVSGKEEMDIEVPGNLNDYLKDNKEIKTIINCAAFVGGVAYGYQYQKELLEKNSKMALNIYEAAIENKLTNIINPISNCVYPANLEVYKEKQMFCGEPHESVYFYAQSRRFLIYLSKAYFEQYSLNTNNVVLSNMYGPYDHFEEERSHAVGAIIKKIIDAKKQSNGKVEIWGSGNQEREWLFVEDGVEAIVKSLKLENGCNTFNIGTNKTISIKEIAENVKDIAKWEGEFVFDLNKPEGVMKKSVDGSYGNNLISWEPKVDIETGLNKTISWYLNNI